MDESVVNTTNVLPLSWWETFDYPVMEQRISLAQYFYRTSVIFVGWLANYFIVLVTTFSPYLRHPRHIFWAAISLIEFLFLLNTALELITVQNRDYSVCPFWVIFYLADDSALMLCHLLATVDRYLSIARYEWYKANVTNRAVILLITLALALSFVVITSPFWTGYKSIYTCTVNLTHVLSVNVWNLLLGIVCLLLQFKIFDKTKTLVRNYVPKYRRSLSASVKFVQSIPPADSGNSGGERTESRVSITFNEPPDPGTENGGDRMDQQLPSVTDPEDVGCFSRKPKGSRIGRMEVQAAHNLFVNILTFWLCTLPMSCCVLVTYWCVWEKGDCDVIFQTWIYVWNAYILHSIYNPVMFMITCSEFHQSLFEMKEHFISKCCATE